MRNIRLRPTKSIKRPAGIRAIKAPTIKIPDASFLSSSFDRIDRIVCISSELDRCLAVFLFVSSYELLCELVVSICCERC